MWAAIPSRRPAKKGHLFGFLLAWQDLLWALCLISPTIILYLFLQRFYVEGLARGAVKG